MAVFQPKFVDLVRNLSTTTGTADFVLGPPVNGFTSFLAECQVGDRFYYSAIGIDRPTEREVGRGTLLAGGVISREPTDGTKTNFSAGTKVIALIAAAEWFARIEAGTTAASRTELAASSSSQGAALLREAGRGGQFVWDGSNLAAFVAADSAQAIYVAPASDPSGASGAWVRSHSGPINVKWFGAKGDGISNDGSAFLSAIALLKAFGANDSGFYKGSPRLFIPAGAYNLGSTTLDITHTLIIEGEGSGMAGGRATYLKWSGATGIRIQNIDTMGATGTQTPALNATYDGAATQIRGLALSGGWSGVEAEYHGIHMRTRAIVDDVYIADFEGDGIHIVADTASSNGEANAWRIDRARIQTCRNGVYCDGGDVNAGLGIGLDIGSCRQWGIWDSSFLGNTWLGGQVDACGTIPGTYTPCTVSYGGNWYSCVVGQEAGASTNPPSGTTADNQWWLYATAGGPSTTGFNVPAWSSGTAYRSGGSYCADNLNSGGRFVGCYAEGGQGPAQIYGSCLADGGNMGHVRGAHLVSSGGVPAGRGGIAAIDPTEATTTRTRLGSGLTSYDGILTHFNTAQNGGVAMTLGWHVNKPGILHWTNWNDYFGLEECPFQISAHQASTTDAPWGVNKMNFPQGYGLGGKKILSAAAVPASGAYEVGDIVYNSAPAPSGKVGWVCTAAGTPGTWKAFGVIDA